MPKTRSTIADHNDAILFRPGEAYGRQLARFAREWGISKNEVAKRLGVLAAHQFTSVAYAAVAELAAAIGGPQDFVIAAQQLQSVVFGADHVSGGAGYEKLSGPKKMAFLSNTVRGLVALRGGDKPTEAGGSLPVEKREIDF